jgi:hypothetical protein
MSSSQDQSSDGTGTGTAAGAPSGQAGDAGRAYVPRPAPGYDDSAVVVGSSVAVFGFTALAGVLMMLSGVASFLEGLAAIIKSHYFVTLPNYAYNISGSGWGWTHLIAGIIVFLAGICLFLDMLWARVTGIILASLSLVMNLLYIPYFPVWSIVVIAIDGFVIWALLAPRRRNA